VFYLPIKSDFHKPSYTNRLDVRQRNFLKEVGSVKTFEGDLRPAYKVVFLIVVRLNPDSIVVLKVYKIDHFELKEFVL
jgi:hypothetical protein